MNFKPTTTKILGSIITGIVLEYLAYYFGNYGIFTGIPIEGATLTTFLFLVFLNFTVYSLIVYLIWSLFSKK